LMVTPIHPQVYQHHTPRWKTKVMWTKLCMIDG
jgi:hypothetical protein